MLRPEREAAWPISAGADGMWGSDGKSAKGVSRGRACAVSPSEYHHHHQS